MRPHTFRTRLRWSLVSLIRKAEIAWLTWLSFIDLVLIAGAFVALGLWLLWSLARDWFGAADLTPEEMQRVMREQVR